MKKIAFLIAFLTVVLLCLPACGQTENGAGLPDSPIRVMMLSGTTGFGAAQMMHAAKAGETTLRYDFSVEQNAANVTAALINGSADIAALPTNAAATLAAKTNGDVQVLALNTRGVLYVVADTGRVTVEDFSDLEGQTVYVPAQNPTFIFSALCAKKGLSVRIDNTFAEPADLRTALVSGGTGAAPVSIAVLPEPMVTMALSANEHLKIVADLTELWEDGEEPDGSLIQGCVVVRRAFAEQYPAAVAQFLSEYEASVNFLLNDPASAAEMIVEAGLFANKAVAEKAIPNCNICFITGTDMAPALNPFLEALFTQNPSAVGGRLPGDDFYWIHEK